MRTKFCLAAVLLSATAVYAQAQTPAAAPRELRPRAYVRRFSLGATLSVVGLSLMKPGGANPVTTIPPVDSLYTSVDSSKRLGFGLTAQVAVTERFAVSLGVLKRHVGYKRNGDIYTGIDNPNTPQDDRNHIVEDEDTRAMLIDIPVTVRYYSTDRHSPGPRWFIEGGGVRRDVSRISTAISSTLNDGALQCCNNTPAVPARRSVIGLVAGAGVQLIDQFGIRVVPQVRFTRWRAQTFDIPSAASRVNQLEGMISLTF